MKNQTSLHKVNTIAALIIGGIMAAALLTALVIAVINVINGNVHIGNI